MTALGERTGWGGGGTRALTFLPRIWINTPATCDHLFINGRRRAIFAGVIAAGKSMGFISVAERSKAVTFHFSSRPLPHGVLVLQSGMFGSPTPESQGME